MPWPMWARTPVWSVMATALTATRAWMIRAVAMALSGVRPERRWLTVVLAMLPASFGLGAGAETNGPLAVAVIGGIVSSTLLTLVVVPAAYSLLENALAKRRG